MRFGIRFTSTLGVARWRSLFCILMVSSWGTNCAPCCTWPSWPIARSSCPMSSAIKWSWRIRISIAARHCGQGSALHIFQTSFHGKSACWSRPSTGEWREISPIVATSQVGPQFLRLPSSRGRWIGRAIAARCQSWKKSYCPQVRLERNISCFHSRNSVKGTSFQHLLLCLFRIQSGLSKLGLCCICIRPGKGSTTLRTDKKLKIGLLIGRVTPLEHIVNSRPRKLTTGSCLGYIITRQASMHHEIKG